MEIQAILEMPYTPQEGREFKALQHNWNGYEIRMNGDTIEAWGETDEEKVEREEQERKLEIASLCMTRLDFIKALETIGISWQTIKGLMEMYPEVEKELMMCSNVYRGNPLIDQFAQTFGITSEQLDELFIQVCNSKEV